MKATHKDAETRTHQGRSGRGRGDLIAVKPRRMNVQGLPHSNAKNFAGMNGRNAKNLIAVEVDAEYAQELAAGNVQHGRARTRRLERTRTHSRELAGMDAQGLALERDAATPVAHRPLAPRRAQALLGRHWRTRTRRTRKPRRTRTEDAQNSSRLEFSRRVENGTT